MTCVTIVFHCQHTTFTPFPHTHLYIHNYYYFVYYYLLLVVQYFTHYNVSQVSKCNIIQGAIYVLSIITITNEPTSYTFTLIDGYKCLKDTLVLKMATLQGRTN